jgi:hypothetical protein
MKWAATPIHVCHGRGGVLHREGEQAAVVLGRDEVGWPSAGGRQLGLGWAERLRRPVGQMGRCKGFGLGEEGGCGGLRWAKKPKSLGPAWEFLQKIQIGLPRPTGRIEEMNRKGP